MAAVQFLLLARAVVDHLTCLEEYLAEAVRGRQPVQIAGAAGQPVVDDEEAPWEVRAELVRAVRHRGGGDVDVVGVAAVACGDTGEQSCGEGGEPFPGPCHRGG